jgi:hypothetical protein
VWVELAIAMTTMPTKAMPTPAKRLRGGFH